MELKDPPGLLAGCVIQGRLILNGIERMFSTQNDYKMISAC